MALETPQGTGVVLGKLMLCTPQEGMSIHQDAACTHPSWSLGTYLAPLGLLYFYLPLDSGSSNTKILAVPCTSEPGCKELSMPSSFSSLVHHARAARISPSDCQRFGLRKGPRLWERKDSFIYSVPGKKNHLSASTKPFRKCWGRGRKYIET